MKRVLFVLLCVAAVATVPACKHFNCGGQPEIPTAPTTEAMPAAPTAAPAAPTAAAPITIK